jgi:outer membrane protein TolC
MCISQRRAVGALLLLSVGAAALSSQQAPSVLTLRDVYQVVDSASPSIRAAAAGARAAESRVPGASKLPDPGVQLQLMNRNLPGLGLNDPLGMNQLQVTQMVPLAGKLRLAGQVAEARANEARESVREVVWSRRESAAEAFFELHRLDATLAIVRETLQLLQGISTSTVQMYAVGEARQSDVLRSQLEIYRITGELEEVTRMRAGAAARFNAGLNRPAADSVGATLLPELPDHPPPLDSLVARALEWRGMVRSSAAGLVAATYSEQVAQREIWPDLELGVIYGQRGMPDGSTDHMISLMVGATVPIWSGRRQLRQRDEASAMREMAAADLEALRSETAGRIAELVAQLDGTSRLRGLYLRSILPQADAKRYFISRTPVERGGPSGESGNRIP